MKAEMDKSIDVQQALAFAKKANSTPTNKSGSINLDNYEHGDIVEINGIPGIVVDREKPLKDIAKNDDELNKIKTLLDPSDPTFSKVDPGVKKSKEFYEVMDKYLEEHIETKMKREEVQKAFAGWEIAGEGMLVPSSDPRAKRYAEAMEKIRSGQIVLPTVEEYERQEAEAKKRQREMADRHLAQQKSAPQQNSTQTQGAQESTVVNTPVPVPEPKVTEMEEMNMNEEDRKKIIQSTQVDPMMAAIANAKEEKPVTTEETVAPQTDAQVASAPSEPKPIDLFAAKEQLDEMRAVNQPTQPAPQVEEEKPDMTFNIPAGREDTFMDNLRPRTAAKIEAAKKIKVVFTKDLNLPKVSRRIADIDGYRSVAPKNVSADITPRILINSGYIGYFKPCGALKWSRLAPAINEDGEFEDMDQAKVIQFCYEQLVTTSIGNLSYREFLENTSVEDIQAMLHAIMGASLPDEQEVMMTCGNCHNEFETKYSISELPDYDNMADDTKEQVQKIQNAKDMIEDAKDVHDESPVMQVCPYTADSTGSIFVFKHSDLTTSVDRQVVSKYLAERYGASAALLSVVITEVRIKIGNTGTDDDWSLSNDPTVICEELLRLSKDNLDEMKAVVDEIPMITPITYSFKGTRTCSNCGQELSQLRQNIHTLVFQIALKAQYFV